MGDVLEVFNNIDSFFAGDALGKGHSWKLALT